MSAPVPSPADLELLAGGLVLRPWQAGDAAAIHQACQDPAMPRLLREHALEAVTRHPAAGSSPDAAVPLGVFDPASGELLGTAGLVRLDRATGEAEIGYWTAPHARGRGVATTAARAIARYGLDVLRLRRLVWRTIVGNHASRLVAARVGVRFEGIRRAEVYRDGQWHDAWAGSVLPGEIREPADADSPDLLRAAARCHTFERGQPTLRTTTRGGEPVRLRPLRPDDAPACMAAATDPESIEFTSVPSPYQLSDAETFVSRVAPRSWALGTAAIFAIADGQDALVGTMDLRLRGDELTTPVGDVGYLVGPWARGRGYASAALAALCEWGFTAMRLHRIEWRAFVGNDASRATAQRAGFQVEGVQREALGHRGRYRDTWVGARLVSGAVPAPETGENRD